MSLLLVLTYGRKVADLKDTAVLLNISAVFDLKQVSKCYPWSYERQSHEDQAFKRNLEQHFLSVL